VPQAWYVVRTKPLSEYRAIRHLTELGFECYLPLVACPTPRPGHADVPLFPSYLFVRYNPALGGTAIVNRIPEVLGLVSFDGYAPSIPDGEILRLRDRIQEANQDGGLWQRCDPGDRVKVLLGKEVALAEVIQGTRSPEHRVLVMMQFLGRHLKAEVPWRSLVHEDIGNRLKDPQKAPRRTRGSNRWISGYRPKELRSAPR
jgi:hypothetical protein